MVSLFLQNVKKKLKKELDLVKGNEQ